jgi:hypothetical protein
MTRPQFNPEKDPVPIAQEAGWDLGPVWTGAENLAHTGIRSPDRPVRSSVAIPTTRPPLAIVTQSISLGILTSSVTYNLCLLCT